MTTQNSTYLENTQNEFATVDILIQSDVVTARTDAFIIAWVKVEKQARKLLSYLIYQYPHFNRGNTKDIKDAISSHNRLYFDDFISGFNRIYRLDFSAIVGSAQYNTFQTEISRINRHRNKILHGQLTGSDLTTRILESEIQIIKNWRYLVSERMYNEIGFDGFGRNSFRKNKTRDLTKDYKHQIKDTVDIRTFINSL